MNNLEQASQALNADIESGKFGSKTQGKAANGKQQDAVDQMAENSYPGAEETTENRLSQTQKNSEKANKKLLDGEDADQLEADRMRQRDYTKKTQALAEEKRALAEEKQRIQEKAQEQKYWDALDADLEDVERDPALLSEFKKIYPAKFHRYVDRLARAYKWDTTTSQQSTQQSNQEQPKKESLYAQLSPEDREALDHARQMAEDLRQEKIKSTDQELTNLQQKFSAKYPDADELRVLAKAQVWSQKLADEGKSLTERHWDNLYKESHDFFNERLNKRQKNTYDQVKDANLRGRGPGPGGGTPGEPVKRRLMKDAESDLLRDFPVGRR